MTSVLTSQPKAGSVATQPRPTSNSLLWPFVLIASLTAYTGVMIRGSYFYADDYLVFGYAHRLGLSWSLVSLNIFGHVAPTERLLHYLPLTISPFNYVVGESIILIIYALLLLSFLWVLRELRVGIPVTLTLLFLVGTSIILLELTLYYDTAVFLLPASAFILSVTALFIRWSRTRKKWALYASWGVFAISFVTQERPLVVLVYLVLLRYIVLPYVPAPWGKRRWLSDWTIWLPYAAIASAYIGYYLTLGSGRGTGLSADITFLRLISEAFMRLAIGLPIHGATWEVWIEVSVVAFTFAALLIMNSRRQLILRAAVFFLICFIVNLGVVLHGVGGIIGANGVASEIQYYVDSIFALGIAVGISCSDWIWANRSRKIASREPRHSSSDTAHSRIFIFTSCAVVIIAYVSLLPFGISSINHDNFPQRFGRSWMTNLRSSLGALSLERPATVIPLTLPAEFVPGFESPYNLESATFPLLPEWRDFDIGPVEVAGPTGALALSSAGDSVSVSGKMLTSYAVQNLAPTANADGSTCYIGNARDGQISVTLPHVVEGRVVAGDLIVSASRSFSMLPYSRNGASLSRGVWRATVPKGVSRLFVTLPGSPVSSFGFTELPPHAHFCIQDVQVGAILEHERGYCNQIDIYGDPKEYVNCGSPWLAAPLSSRGTH